MAFLDKLSKITKDLTDKTSDMIETNKLQSKIASEQSKITECKTKIGDVIVTQVNNGTLTAPEIQEYIEEIKAAQIRIDELNKAILEMKTNNEPVDSPATPTTPITPTIPTETMPDACPNCQEILADNTKFCPGCGTKIGQ